MKKLVIAGLLVLSILPFTAKAQGRYGADSVNCVLNLSYYTEYYKQKNYNDAIVYWRKAYKYCPATASQNLLIHGTTLLKIVADKSKGAAKKAVADSILTLQDQRAKLYPKYAVVALNNKARYAAMYLSNDPKKCFDIYEEVKNELGEKAGSFIYENQFAMAMELFKNGKMTSEEVINVYTQNNDILEGIIAGLTDAVEAQADDAAKKKVQDALDEMTASKKHIEDMFLASKVASCADVIELFSPRLDADPDNLKLIKNIVSILNATDDCVNNDLYLKAVTSLNKQEPSAATSYYLFRMYKARGNDSEAIKYLEKAANAPEISDNQRAEYTIDLARLELNDGNRGAAINYANKVISLSNTFAGDAYMVIAKAWGSMRCGGDEISSKANFWVAVDYLQKAKAANPDLSAEANNLIGRYSAYFPNAADAFMYNITAGQGYTASCGGMTARTTVRTNK